MILDFTLSLFNHTPRKLKICFTTAGFEPKTFGLLSSAVELDANLTYISTPTNLAV